MNTIIKQKSCELAGCRCQRCGFIFKIDLNINDKLWQQIHMSWNLLCGACIMQLLEFRIMNNFEEYDYYTLTK